MNWVDLLLILVVISGAWAGWRRGFVQATLFLSTLVLSVIGGFALYRHPAAWLVGYWPALGVWIQPLSFVATFVLLHALLERPGAILSRSQLEERLYGWGEEVSSNAVEVLIHGVRRKLGADVIRNVRGLGWRVSKEST